MTIDLFPDGIRALNVGVAEFAEPPIAHGATVVQLDWRPPAGGDRELGLLLARLEDDPDDPIGIVLESRQQEAELAVAAGRRPPIELDDRRPVGYRRLGEFGDADVQGADAVREE